MPGRSPFQLLINIEIFIIFISRERNLPEILELLWTFTSVQGRIILQEALAIRQAGRASSLLSLSRHGICPGFALWHKDCLIIDFLCMEATYPNAIKNQRKAKNAPSRGHFVTKPLVG